MALMSAARAMGFFESERGCQQGNSLGQALDKDDHLGTFLGRKRRNQIRLEALVCWGLGRHDGECTRHLLGDQAHQEVGRWRNLNRGNLELHLYT